VSIIPVRVPAGATPVLASERRFAANRGHPLDGLPCPACDRPLGEQVTVLILAGTAPEDRKEHGWTYAAAVAVHAACAGVPEEESAEAIGRTVTFDLTDAVASFVLTEALEEFAVRQRDQAADEHGHEMRERWATLADRMRAQVEAAG
jgi:hypothetical protein